MSELDKAKKFYLGVPVLMTDSFDKIMCYTERDFEWNHHFIQWLFPIDTGSIYNLAAPVLTREELYELASDTDIRFRVYEAFEFVCRMYGLDVVCEDGKMLVRQSESYTGYWLAPNDHNHLRITRILKSLTCMGLGEFAQAFLKCLLQLIDEHPNCVTEKSLMYWKEAVEYHC